VLNYNPFAQHTKLFPSPSIMKGALVALLFGMAAAVVSGASMPVQRRHLGELLASFSLPNTLQCCRQLLNPSLRCFPLRCFALLCSVSTGSSSNDLGDFGFDNGDFFKKFASEKAAAEQQKEKVKQRVQNEQAKANEKAKAATEAEAAAKHKQDLKEHGKNYNKDFEANINENETDAFEKVKAFHNKTKDANVDFHENFAETDKQKAEEASKFAKQAASKAQKAAVEQAKAEDAFKKGEKLLMAC
jgi:pyruvate/2-oxoglutarate dehydrogenase complex dihydrolipoamide acyltransferase (E2) component